MNILTVDVGTSSMRASLLTHEGAFLGKKQIPYSPRQKGGGIVEQDARDWQRALFDLLRFGGENGADAVALTAPRSSVIPVDASGEPIGSAVMWQDTRQQKLLSSLTDREDEIKKVCGAGLNTVFSGGKMAWIAQNEPQRYARTDRFFIIPDYLIFLMCGKRVTDHTYGSRTLLMDLRSRRWSDEMLELFGVDKKKLCELVPPASVVGEISEKVSSLTGIRAGIPVITCGGDQQCGALGQGVYRPGRVSANLGTGGFLVTTVDEMPENSTMILSASAVPGQYIMESDVLCCGSALSWFLRAFCPGEGNDAVRRAMRQSPPGANGVRALPYFQGRSNPEWDADARASFFGLSLSSRKNDLLRALVEGVCWEISRHVGLMEEYGGINELRIGGGLSRSRPIMQMLSDMSGKRVVCAENSDATVFGAWMNAAVCLGHARSYDEAFEMIRPKKEYIYEPDPKNTGVCKDISRDLEQSYKCGRR